MTTPPASNKMELPLWSDLLSLQLTLVGSVAGAYIGHYVYFYIWEKGPFIPSVIGLCCGLVVVALTRRGGPGVALIAVTAALITQLTAHHETRPIGLTDFYTFLGKLAYNMNGQILVAHLPGLLLAWAIPGLLPLLWKKK